MPTTTNQFFDTLTMQVSSWIAARLAVLVEFAVFLISSTSLFTAVCFVFAVQAAFLCLIDILHVGYIKVIRGKFRYFEKALTDK